MEEESDIHAVIRCGHATALRLAMRKVWCLPDEEQCLRINTGGLLALIDELETDEAAKLLLLLWRTWQIRNNITHSSDKLSVEGSVRFLQKYWRELCEIRKGDNKNVVLIQRVSNLCLNRYVQGSPGGRKDEGVLDSTATGMVESKC